MFRFDSLNDFLYMQGHGVFVWTAYVLAAVVMGWLIVSPWLQQRRLRQQIQRQYRREQAPAQTSLREG